MIKNDDEFESLLSKRNSGKVTYGIELKINIEKGGILEAFLKRMGHNADKLDGNWIMVDNARFDSKSGYFKLYSWTTITNSHWHTFDTGIVAVDNINIGILWATDPL